MSVRFIGRHHVGDVAHDEEFSRAGIEDRFGRGAGVATGDDHRPRFLTALGEGFVSAAAVR